MISVRSLLVTENPFLGGPLQEIADQARDEAKADYQRRLLAAKKSIELLDIGVGDRVRVDWEVDLAYGGVARYHIGVITQLDDWIKIAPSNKTPGRFYSSIAGLKTISRVDEAALEQDNPFMQPAPTNPFMA